MVKPTFSNFTPYLLFSLSGLLCGIGTSNFVLSHQFESIRIQNTTYQNRIQLLSDMLQEQTVYAGALGDATAKIVPQIDPPALIEVETQQQVSIKPPEAKNAKPTPIKRPGPIPKIITEPEQIGKEIISAKPKIEEPRHVDPPPVEGKKIEALSIKKAGVSKIDRDSVTLESGAQIKLGGNFPSGEKLLFVDPANQHIVTDKRQLLLLN